MSFEVKSNQYSVESFSLDDDVEVEKDSFKKFLEEEEFAIKKKLEDLENDVSLDEADYLLDALRIHTQCSGYLSKTRKSSESGYFSLVKEGPEIVGYSFFGLDTHKRDPDRVTETFIGKSVRKQDKTIALRALDVTIDKVRELGIKSLKLRVNKYSRKLAYDNSERFGYFVNTDNKLDNPKEILVELLDS